MDKLSNENKNIRKIKNKGRHLSKFNENALPKECHSVYIEKCNVNNEKINEAHKYDVNTNKSKKWELSQSIPLGYLLIEHKNLTL